MTTADRVRKIMQGIGGRYVGECFRLLRKNGVAITAVDVLSQTDADKYMSLLDLSKSPAVRIVWAELAGYVDFRPWLAKIDWLILSGSPSAPTDLDGLRRVIADCRKAGVKIWVRSVGVKTYFNDGRGVCDDSTYVRFSDPSEWPSDLNVREVPLCLEGE